MCYDGISQELSVKKAQILATPCGVCDSVNKTNTYHTATIGDYVAACSRDTEIKTRCRELYTTDKAKYDEIKRNNVTAWSLGGAGGVDKESIIKANGQNGFVQFDIDHIQDDYVDEIKQAMIALPFVAVCCVSLSCNGVCGLIYAPDYVDKQDAIKSEIYGIIEDYLQIKFDGVGFEVDTSVKDLARRRIESFDAEIYVAEMAKPFENTQTLIDKRWEHSKIKEYSELFGYDVMCPDNACVVALLALMAAHTKLSVWDRDITDPTKCYQFRIGGVMLALSGAGKGILTDTFQEIANELGISIQNCKSTASLSLSVSKSANVLSQDKDNPKVYHWEPKRLKDVVPIIELNDEDYANREVNKQAVYGMDKYAERRKLLDRIYNPQSTKKDSLPEYGFTACYQYLCVSQFDSFAEATANDRTDTGDVRREILGELPKVEAIEGRSLGFNALRARKTRHPAQPNVIIEALKKAKEHRESLDHQSFEQKRDEPKPIDTLTTKEIATAIKSGDYHVYDWDNTDACLFTFLRMINAISKNDTDALDCQTHLANIAVAECYLSCRDKITARDVVVAGAITQATFKLRKKLRERSQEFASIGATDKCIQMLIEYWEKLHQNDVISQQAYDRWKGRRGLMKKAKEWDELNLIAFREGSSTKYRLATDKEREQIAILAAIKNTADENYNALTTQWNANHGHDEQWQRGGKGRPGFAQDTPESQKIRINEFISKCLDNGKCGKMAEGYRNNTLFALKNALKNAEMLNGVAFDILSAVGARAGLSEKEIKHILRDSGV